MIVAGSSHEDIKYIISKRYEKENFVLVDDLFILSQDNCKKSDIQLVVVCPELIISDEAKELVDHYSKYKCYSVSQKVFMRLCSKENCAGILIITRLKENRDFVCKDNLILICDALEISGNIGTIFRTAEAVQLDGIIFTNCRAKIHDDRVVRSSRGMIFNVPFFIENDMQALNSLLEDNGFRKVVCEPEQGIDFKSFDYSGSLAIIVGSERYGVNKFWFDAQSEYIKITMFGKMDSLNVGVATSITLYEAKYNRMKL